MVIDWISWDYWHSCHSILYVSLLSAHSQQCHFIIIQKYWNVQSCYCIYEMDMVSLNRTYYQQSVIHLPLIETPFSWNNKWLSFVPMKSTSKNTSISLWNISLQVHLRMFFMTSIYSIKRQSSIFIHSLCYSIRFYNHVLELQHYTSPLLCSNTQPTLNWRQFVLLFLFTFFIVIFLFNAILNNCITSF